MFVFFNRDFWSLQLLSYFSAFSSFITKAVAVWRDSGRFYLKTLSPETPEPSSCVGGKWEWSLKSLRELCGSSNDVTTTSQLTKIHAHISVFQQKHCELSLEVSA